MSEEFPVVIVGTGFSGLAMATQLRDAGIDSFTMLERADRIGGTWRDNSYPGAACDVPSHLYSFSFAPNPDWSRAFSPGWEIQDYLERYAAERDLAGHVRFGSEVTGADFDEASGTWTVHVRGAAPLRARALVLGNGALSNPARPDIPGLDEFAGKLFHSARWDHGYDLRGKTVGVIGTGASAIQFVPEIARDVDRLHLFQRTPPWVLPRPDRPYAAWEKRLFRSVPAARWLHRAWIYWTMEARVVGFAVDPRLMRWVERYAKRFLRRSIRDPELRRKLTPDYVIGCKRILMSNDYYPALERPNVEVVTEGIERVTRDGIRTRDGRERKLDALILGTGFTATEYLTPIAVRGRDGRLLADVLRTNPATYLGITVHGYPNLFLMMGPNTGLGHNSMVFMIEAQARYARQAIEAMRAQRLARLDVRDDVSRAFTDRLQQKLGRSVWSSGCQSWYLRDGYNATLWPGFTFEYWLATRQIDLHAFERVALDAEARTPRLEPTPVASAAR